MKRYSFLIVWFALISTFSFSQSLLNKLKNKSAQEVNKLERNVPASKQNQNNKNKLSSNVTRSILVSLQDDENFDYGENCIDLGSSLNQASFIVTKNRGDQAKCFSYKDGVRTPVACPNSNANCITLLQCSYNKLRSIDLESDEAKTYIISETESHALTTPTVSDQQMKMMEAYMTKEQLDEMKKQLAEAQKQSEGKTYSTVKSQNIKFNGKSYGPFNQLFQFYLSADGKTFYAVTLNVDQTTMAYTYKMITSASAATIAIASMTPPFTCFAATDNSEFAMVIAYNEGKYQIVTSKGKTMPIDIAYFGGGWYSGSNHLLILSNNQLTQDGNVIKTFDTNSSVDPCNIYLASDSKGITIVKNNTISFADGDYFEYPLKIALVSENGKNYFKWLALENREVVIYQKPY